MTWRRGLSGQVIEKRRAGEERVRLLLAGDAADPVVDDAAGFARTTLERMNSGSWQWTSAVDSVIAQEARALLALASRFDAAAARADAGRFGLVFGRVGILPPDQYLSLVVQATEGCSFNTCTFCDLYHDGYRVKTHEEFRQHVSRCWAISARRRRSVREASSSAPRTRWPCRWRGCCRFSRRCSRNWMPRDGRVRVRRRIHGRPKTVVSTGC